MEDATKCIYAHGKDDMVYIDCKYGSRCYKNNCLFDHGKFSIPTMVYDIPIIHKRKKQKCLQ